MRPLLLTALAAGALFGALDAPEACAQVDPSVTLYYGSPYIFRGVPFSSGFVVQPTVQATWAGAFVGFFGNLDPSSSTTSTGRKVAFNEADVFAGYGRTVGPLTLTGTYTFYTFPVPNDDELRLNPTQEVALTAGVAAPLAPSAYAVYDFDETDDNPLQGFYGEVGVGPKATFRGQSFAFGLKGAFDAGYLHADDAFRLAHVTGTAASTFAFGGVSVTPLVALQVNASDTYRAFFDRPIVFYGGLSVGF